MQARIFYPSRSQTYTVTPLAGEYASLWSGGATGPAVNSVQKNEITRTAIVKTIGQELQKEVAAICSDDFNSITRQKPQSVIENFSHVKQSLLKEMMTRAPTLMTLLKQCLKTNRCCDDNDSLTYV